MTNDLEFSHGIGQYEVVCSSLPLEAVRGRVKSLKPNWVYDAALKFRAQGEDDSANTVNGAPCDRLGTHRHWIFRTW